jgi:hypothetical protein
MFTYTRTRSLSAADSMVRMIQEQMSLPLIANSTCPNERTSFVKQTNYIMT